MTPSADWQNFAVMTGGASGALTGLLFVSVSLNASRIAGHQGLRASTAQTLVLFLAPLVMAMILLVPGQGDGVLGAELVAGGLSASASLLAIGQAKRALTDDDKRLISIFDRRDTNVTQAKARPVCQTWMRHKGPMGLLYRSRGETGLLRRSPSGSRR
jgi:hypothetical protein